MVAMGRIRRPIGAASSTVAIGVASSTAAEAVEATAHTAQASTDAATAAQQAAQQAGGQEPKASRLYFSEHHRIQRNEPLMLMESRIQVEVTEKTGHMGGAAAAAPLGSLGKLQQRQESRRPVG